jgi:UDP-GlcNAc:undecaprenyl-phosphate GlcNAc-1-phosphate transferase
MLLSVLIAPTCIRFASRVGMMDDPRSLPHKIHTVPTPRAGGLVLLIAVLVVGAATGVLLQPPLRTIFLASLAVFAAGLWDDAKGIGALPKLAGQVLGGIILLQGGVAIQFLHNPPIDSALTLFWVVGITNAYNLVDSMDGQAIGLAGLAAAFLMLATMGGRQENSAAFAAILVGACAGLAFYNITPARLFLGDSGSQILGFWLAGLGIIFTPSPLIPQLSSWFVPILLMLVPILDTTLVTTSRLRSRRPFYVAGRDHTYHRLVAMGVEPMHAVLTILLASAAAGCLAFIALALPPVWANLVFLAALVAGCTAILWLQTRPRI